MPDKIAQANTIPTLQFLRVVGLCALFGWCFFFIFEHFCSFLKGFSWKPPLSALIVASFPTPEHEILPFNKYIPGDLVLSRLSQLQ